jgi:hypothetical protein
MSIELYGKDKAGPYRYLDGGLVPPPSPVVKDPTRTITLEALLDTVTNMAEVQKFRPKFEEELVIEYVPIILTKQEFEELQKEDILREWENLQYEGVH